MDLVTAGVGFLVGLALVLVSAKRLVDAAMQTSLSLGVSAFLVSVAFIGFDPENLAVGISGATEGSAGIALGSVIGAAMVAIGLAFGITALLRPMRFAQAPLGVIIVPLLALALFAALAADGDLDRIDGALLVGSYVAAVGYLYRLGRRGVDVRAEGSPAEEAEQRPRHPRVRSMGLLALALAGIAVGSSVLVAASERVIAQVGISDTAFGLSILALAVSIEELARELPSAARGRADITYGNVVGSVLAFFLFNAGVIALVRPIAVPVEALATPMLLVAVTLVVVTVSISRRSVARWVGGVLLGLYVAFVRSLFALGRRAHGWAASGALPPQA